MNDTELDQRLRAHGEAWREDHQSRPGVDWSAIAAPRRSYRGLAAAGAVLAAVAVAVPVVINVVGAGPKSISPTAVRQGAPTQFYALAPHSFGVTAPGSSVTGAHATPVPGRALAASPDGTHAYVAVVHQCQTTIKRYHRTGLNQHTMLSNQELPSSLTAHPMITLNGSAVSADGNTDTLAPAMALSPDGSRLAVALEVGCHGRQQLAIVDLTKQNTVTYSSEVGRFARFTSLAWSTDGQLAYVLAPRCPSNGNSPAGGCTGASGLGTHILDTSVAPLRLADSNHVLPYTAPLTNDFLDGPVLWWHGQFAVITNGVMRAVPSVFTTSPGDVLARNLPRTVYAVSVDPTGEHLLMTAGELTVGSFSRNNGPVTYVATAPVYRWDRGVLSPIGAPDGWPGFSQVAW